MTSGREKLIIALDSTDYREVLLLFNKLKHYADIFKLGLGLLFSGNMPIVVEAIRASGKKVMGDFKLYDIPMQLGISAKGLAKYNFDFVTVSATSKLEGMRAVKENMPNTKVLAVTVLTSVTPEDLYNMGFIQMPIMQWQSYTTVEQKQNHLKNAVVKMSLLAECAGLDGVICSGEELELLKKYKKLENILLVVPGTRSRWYKEYDDQKRIVTPIQAIRAGADYLVVGRPITKPAPMHDHGLATEQIISEINYGLRCLELKKGELK